MLKRSEYKNALNNMCNKCKKNNRCKELCSDCDELLSFIDESFVLQLTASECDFIVKLLEPLEKELGMDVALLINKMYGLRNVAQKDENNAETVESIEFN